MKNIIKRAAALLLLVAAAVGAQTNMPENKRPRVREAGLTIGVLPTGARNAITDVRGVRVGHRTIARGENVRDKRKQIEKEGPKIKGDGRKRAATDRESDF